jgi:hypothetical protein
MTLPERSPWQAYFVTLLEDRTLDVQEEDEYNSSFSLGMGHDSNVELAEE